MGFSSGWEATCRGRIRTAPHISSPPLRACLNLGKSSHKNYTRHRHADTVRRCCENALLPKNSPVGRHAVVASSLTRKLKSYPNMSHGSNKKEPWDISVQFLPASILRSQFLLRHPLPCDQLLLLLLFHSVVVECSGATQTQLPPLSWRFDSGLLSVDK